MKVGSPRFKEKTLVALADPNLRQALGQSRKGFVNGRAALVAGPALLRGRPLADLVIRRTSREFVGVAASTCQRARSGALINTGVHPVGRATATAKLATRVQPQRATGVRRSIFGGVMCMERQAVVSPATSAKATRV